MSLSASNLLQVFFEKKKASRSGFSLRTFAKIMKLSPSFVSALMKGQKSIPSNRVEELAKVLELDHLSVNQLKKAIACEILQEHDLKPEEVLNQTPEALTKYEPVPKTAFSILSHWYNVAILDLCTCSNFEKDLSWISEKLGISKYQAQFAIEQLVSQGLLVETVKGYEKVSDKIRMSFHESHTDIRKFHLQMLEKAKEELLTKTTSDAFQKREITGITIPANPQNIERARVRLAEALHEVAEILSEGETTELYQINAQLFTLLKK